MAKTILVVLAKAKVTEWSKCLYCGEKLRKGDYALRNAKGHAKASLCQGCLDRAYHLKDESFEVVEFFDDDEQDFHRESMMEHFNDSRIAGMSQQSAWEDWDFKQGR